MILIMGSAAKSLHIVVFPFMAHGHTIPMLDLSNRLARRGVDVTVITTPANFPDVRSKLSKTPKIAISVIPFPRLEGALEGVENTVDFASQELRGPFVQATKELREPFEKVLEEMFQSGRAPIGVISDFFLGWTLDSCNHFGVPRIVTYGMSGLSQALLLSSGAMVDHIMSLSPEGVIEFPKFPTPFDIKRADFPHLKNDPRGTEMFSLIRELTEADLNSWGNLVNSFEDIERDHVSSLESLYSRGAKAWCVGPLLLSDQTKDGMEEEDGENNKGGGAEIEWLDKQEGLGSVLYVSFGSEAKLSDEQLDEIAIGLEAVEQPFVWVVKSRTWAAPAGWEERVEGRGLVVRSWVDQRRILGHPKTGGFLTHCGWNSVLEGLSMGVPLLAWPQGAEQPLNAKIVADWLGAGIRVLEMSDHQGGIIIRSEVISEKVRELMGGGEKGRKVRERAQEVKKMAWRAMEKGGSSDRKLNELIHSLALTRKDT